MSVVFIIVCLRHHCECCFYVVGMKKAVYRPANYRKNTLTKNSSASSAQEELTRSLKRTAKANGHKNQYSSSRPWLK